MKFLSFTDNKKTYFGAALIVLAGALQAFHINVPEWVLLIVGGGTVVAHRAAIQKVMYAIQWDRIAAKEVLGMVTTKDKQ